MSEIDYNNLLFEISESLDELNLHERLVFLCRGKLASGIRREDVDSIQDSLALFKVLEERNHLGPNRLGVMKNLLKGVKEWSLLGKVKKFESKRKEYLDLLEQIIPALDELNDLGRLISICRVEIPEANEANIPNVRSLFKELENHSCLGIDCLDILKEILTQTEQSDLLKEVDKFEERRNREDDFETKKAQASAFVSSVGNTLIGVLNIKTVFKVVAGGIITASTLDVWSRGSSFDQLVTAVDRCVLPAGTRLLQITEGCVCLTVQAENLSALNSLWSLYQDGTLKSRLKTYFVTDELRELAGGEEVEAIVTIDDQAYEKACVELTRKAQVLLCPDGREEQRILKIHRRNSDSNLYCKSRENERQVKPLIHQGKDTHEEKLAFVQSNSEKAEDALSMTTETSDSGMLGTHGTPSEHAMEEARGSVYNLCLKDLSKVVTAEIACRLEIDAVAKELFLQSIGLDLKKMFPEVLENISELFPDTPVRMLKDVFEGLQLYDLVELLEKAAKPRALRPAFSMKEISKLLNTSNRPTVFYDKMAVLVIDGNAQTADDSAEKIGSFFKVLNSQNEITTVMARPLMDKREVLRQLMSAKEKKEMGDQNDEKCEEMFKNQLEKKILDEKENWRKVRQIKQKLQKVKERREQWSNEEKVKIEKEIKQEEEEIQKEKGEFETAVSTVFHKWIENKGKESTLHAVFEISGEQYYNDIDEMIERCLTNNLALIPDEAKLVITRSHWEEIAEISETLYLAYGRRSEKFVATLLEILSKRWGTLDLISMMLEVQRTLPLKLISQHALVKAPLNYARYIPVIVHDSLSSLPRLQMTEKIFRVGDP